MAACGCDHHKAVTVLRDVVRDPGQTQQSILIAEASNVVAQPPYFRTTRRKHVYESIGFPEGFVYDPTNLKEPLTNVPDAFRKQTNCTDFPSYTTTIEEAQSHFLLMFQELRLLEKFQIAPNTVREFFRQITNSYRDQAYHNLRHALDVAQFCFVVIREDEIAAEILQPLEQLALLLLSLGHDIDHPGVNNGFLVKTQDPLALIYNDRSVLENAHAAALFLMMHNHPDCNVLANLSPDEHTRMRKLILCGILATDMDLHGPLLKKFNDRQPLLGIPASERTDADTFMLIECLSKCGDLAHLIRPWAHAKHWEDLVMIEFFEQGDREKQLGFPVMSLFDRSVCNVPASQVWFYENVGRQLFEGLARHIPRGEAYLKQMNEINIPEWSALRDKP